jgi:hypothetical protein
LQFAIFANTLVALNPMIHRDKRGHLKMPQNQFASGAAWHSLLLASLLVPSVVMAQVTVPPITLPQVTLPAAGKRPAPAPVIATPLPAILNYQGFLTDQKTGVPVNGSLAVNFKIYDALTGGSLLYSEDQSSSISNGVLNAQIGSNTRFPDSLTFDKPYWLEVNVNGSVLTPRQAIASAPFARSAGALPSRAGGNTAAGDSALGSLNTLAGFPQNGNVALGWHALSVLTSGEQNVAVGNRTLDALRSGSNNIALGPYSGVALNSGIGNIYIGHAGPSGSENQTMRMGSGITRTFIGGISNVVPDGATGRPVVINGLSQLGNISDLTITPTGLNFGSKLGQMLNLWGSQFGVGVQANTLYFRSNSDFAWYANGVHSDAVNDPGGGAKLMVLNPGGLTVNGTFVSQSDRSAKEDFADVDPREVLAKVAQLPLMTWNYRDDNHKVKHLGPMAQDFHAAFNIGPDDLHITMVDADGVAFAAIQGLYRLVQEKDAALQAQTVEIALLKAAEARTHAQLAAMKSAVELLLARSGQATFASFNP